MPRCAKLIAPMLLASSAVLARTEERAVPEFDAVNVESGIRVSVEIGPRKPVRVEADEETLSFLETRVEDGALHIGFKPHGRWTGTHRVQVSIQTPQLRAVSASGGSIVRATFSRAEECGIEASGGSEVRARGIDAGRLSVHGSGGSVFDLQGRADALGLELSGGSQLHGSDLAIQDVDVQASGGSQGELRANGRIRGSLSGGSELHVRGGARARVATSGGSSVEVED
jgi:hypothetical protein